MEFKEGLWNTEINVRDFIQKNYTPYDGDDKFLSAPTDRTLKLWEQLSEKMKIERARHGVYDIDEKTTDIRLIAKSALPKYEKDEKKQFGKKRK